MVVVCGTATTIDFLSPDGVFKGGTIMPGVGLMLRSLHEGTAALPDQDGDFFDYPTQTVDAIASGCQHAQAGAIERMYAHESGVVDDLTCLISGGAARAVTAAPDDPAPVPREPGARGALPRVDVALAADVREDARPSAQHSRGALPRGAGWMLSTQCTCSGLGSTFGRSRLTTTGCWPLRHSTHDSGSSSLALISWCGTNGGT